MQHRHLRKILDTESDAERFESTGEDIDLLVDTLREVQKLRRARRFLQEKFHLDLPCSAAIFEQLLTIPEIDKVEIPNKMGEVDLFSRKAEREPGTAVSTAELNVVLQALNRDLSRIDERRSAELGGLLPAEEMTGDLLQAAIAVTASLRALNAPGTGYLFSAWKARGVERKFRRLFPHTEKAHPLRKSLDRVERELGFYNDCLEINRKWGPLGLNLFVILRNDGLSSVVENIRQLGNSLWNVVYNGQRLPACMALAGIRFGDVRTLFEETGPPGQVEEKRRDDA
ncbi:MAG: hypothetical protein ACE5G9_13075 [Nitrospinales bacterium]